MLYWTSGLHFHSDLGTVYTDNWACFINCSKSITNSSRYKPVNCLSANNSFVYVMVSYYLSGCLVSSLEPSCGYLAMIPFVDRGSWRTEYPFEYPLENASYTNIIEYVRKGFSVRFPDDYYSGQNASWIFETCRNNSAR